MGQETPMMWRLFQRGGSSNVPLKPNVWFGLRQEISRLNADGDREYFLDPRNYFQVLKHEWGHVKDLHDNAPGTNWLMGDTFLPYNHRRIYAEFRANLYAFDWNYQKAYDATFRSYSLDKMAKDLGFKDQTAEVTYRILQHLAEGIDEPLVGPVRDQAIRIVQKELSEPQKVQDLAWQAVNDEVSKAQTDPKVLKNVIEGGANWTTVMRDAGIDTSTQANELFLDQVENLVKQVVAGRSSDRLRGSEFVPDVLDLIDQYRKLQALQLAVKSGRSELTGPLAQQAIRYKITQYRTASQIPNGFLYSSFWTDELRKVGIIPYSPQGELLPELERLLDDTAAIANEIWGPINTTHSSPRTFVDQLLKRLPNTEPATPTATGHGAASILSQIFQFFPGFRDTRLAKGLGVASLVAEIPLLMILAMFTSHGFALAGLGGFYLLHAALMLANYRSRPLTLGQLLTPALLLAPYALVAFAVAQTSPLLIATTLIHVAGDVLQIYGRGVTVSSRANDPNSAGSYLRRMLTGWLRLPMKIYGMTPEVIDNQIQIVSELPTATFFKRIGFFGSILLTKAMYSVAALGMLIYSFNLVIAAPKHSPVVFLAGVLAATLALVIIHELGHIVGGLMSGFKDFKVRGPSLKGKYAAGIQYTSKLSDRTPMQSLLISLGGPYTSYVTGFIALLITLTIGLEHMLPFWAGFLTIFLIGSFWVPLENMLPIIKGNDGHHALRDALWGMVGKLPPDASTPPETVPVTPLGNSASTDIEQILLVPLAVGSESTDAIPDIHLIPHSHLHPLTAGEITKDLLNYKDLSNEEYQARVQAILDDQRRLIDAHKDEIRQVKEIFRSHGGVIPIAFEASAQEARELLDHAQENLATLSNLFRMHKFPHFETVANDFLLLLVGPAIYLKATEFPEVEFIPVDDDLAKQNTDRAIKELGAALTALGSWSEEHGKLTEYHDVSARIAKSLESQEKPEPVESLTLAESFGDDHAKALVIHTLLTVSQFLSQNEQRDKKIVDNLRSRKGPLILIIVAQHAKSLMRELPNRIQIAAPPAANETGAFLLKEVAADALDAVMKTFMVDLITFLSKIMQVASIEKIRPILLGQRSLDETLSLLFLNRVDPPADFRPASRGPAFVFVEDIPGRTTGWNKILEEQEHIAPLGLLIHTTDKPTGVVLMPKASWDKLTDEQKAFVIEHETYEAAGHTHLETVAWQDVKHGSGTFNRMVGDIKLRLAAVSVDREVLADDFASDAAMLSGLYQDGQGDSAYAKALADAMKVQGADLGVNNELVEAIIKIILGQNGTAPRGAEAVKRMVRNLINSSFQPAAGVVADAPALTPAPAPAADMKIHFEGRILTEKDLDANGVARFKLSNEVLRIDTRMGKASLEGPMYNRDVPLTEGARVTVGRTLDNSLIGAGAGLSRHHAVIVVNGDEIHLTDLGSENGTYLIPSTALPPVAAETPKENPIVKFEKRMVEPSHSSVREEIYSDLGNANGSVEIKRDGDNVHIVMDLKGVKVFDRRSSKDGWLVIPLEGVEKNIYESKVAAREKIDTDLSKPYNARTKKFVEAAARLLNDASLSEEEKAERVFEMTRQAFWRSNISYEQRKSAEMWTSRYAAEHINQSVGLDDFLDAGYGVCRHHGILFKLLADAAGLNSSPVRGTVIGGRHLWNELTLKNGDRYFIDAFNFRDIYHDYEKQMGEFGADESKLISREGYIYGDFQVSVERIEKVYCLIVRPVLGLTDAAGDLQLSIPLKAKQINGAAIEKRYEVVDGVPYKPVDIIDPAQRTAKLMGDIQVAVGIGDFADAWRLYKELKLSGSSDGGKAVIAAAPLIHEAEERYYLTHSYDDAVVYLNTLLRDGQSLMHEQSSANREILLKSMQWSYGRIVALVELTRRMGYIVEKGRIINHEWITRIDAVREEAAKAVEQAEAVARGASQVSPFAKLAGNLLKPLESHDDVKTPAQPISENPTPNFGVGTTILYGDAADRALAKKETNVKGEIFVTIDPMRSATLPPSGMSWVPLETVRENFGKLYFAVQVEGQGVQILKYVSPLAREVRYLLQKAEPRRRDIPDEVKARPQVEALPDPEVTQLPPARARLAIDHADAEPYLPGDKIRVLLVPHMRQGHVEIPDYVERAVVCEMLEKGRWYAVKVEGIRGIQFVKHLLDRVPEASPDNEDEGDHTQISIKVPDVLPVVQAISSQNPPGAFWLETVNRLGFLKLNTRVRQGVAHFFSSLISDARGSTHVDPHKGDVNKLMRGELSLMDSLELLGLTPKSPPPEFRERPGDPPFQFVGDDAGTNILWDRLLAREGHTAPMGLILDTADHGKIVIVPINSYKRLTSEQREFLHDHEKLEAKNKSHAKTVQTQGIGNYNDMVYSMKAQLGLEEASLDDMNTIWDAISRAHPRDAARIINRNYKVLLYGDDSTLELMAGLTTHADFYDGVIYMAKGEYLRLKAKGTNYLAARVGRKAWEISQWRGTIGVIRNVQGNRKWIMDHMDTVVGLNQRTHDGGVLLEKQISGDPQVQMDGDMDDPTTIGLPHYPSAPTSGNPGAGFMAAVGLVLTSSSNPKARSLYQTALQHLHLHMSGLLNFFHLHHLDAPYMILAVAAVAFVVIQIGRHVRTNEIRNKLPLAVQSEETAPRDPSLDSTIRDGVTPPAMRTPKFFQRFNETAKNLLTPEQQAVLRAA